ncbi:MAG: GNAT family N-acetyltransferase [Halanaerobiales bacterium]|nr:GNAT family N-acetyltransferase [Halanaerobiales bacterium]
MKIEYKEDIKLQLSEVKNLYEDAGWVAYTQDIPTLMKAIENSLKIITAWDGDQLVGLIRVVGDGLTIVYIQDILILNSYRRKKIGTQLVEQVLENYNHVRQKVLLTEEGPDRRQFYEKQGFFSCDKGELVAFAKFGA